MNSNIRIALCLIGSLLSTPALAEYTYAPPIQTQPQSMASAWFDRVCSSAIGQTWVRATGGWGCSGLGYANPVWFGADPTGVADSTGAIGSAFSANRTVLIPCGTYLATIVNYPNLGGTIQGQQRDCAVIKLKNGGTCCDFINFSPSFFSTSVLRDITIECNGTQQNAGTGNCISAASSQYNYIVNATIQNAYKTAIYMQTGLNISSSQIAEWNVSGTVGNAITIAGVYYDVTIGPGNDIWQVFGGPVVHSSSQSVAAISQVSSENPVRIDTNNIDANGTQIYINPGVQTSTQTIVNNSIHCAVYCFDGIVFNNVIDSTIFGNSFFALEASAIRLTNGSAHNIICGNSIIAATPPITPVWGIKEDAGVGPNNYCGDRPTDGNPIYGTFASGFYSVNGPTTGTGATSIVGCAAGVCTDSTDLVGRLVTGTTVTSSAVNFAFPFKFNPACIFTPETGGTPLYSFNQAISTSGFTVGFSVAVTGMTVAYRCSGVR